MARIFAKHAWLPALLTVLPLYCPAQNKPFAIPLVPAADWRQQTSSSLPVSAVGRFGGDTVVEQEYGVKSLDVRTYQLGKLHTQVLVEPAADTTSAYGLLTFYRNAGMTREPGIELAFSDANQTLMARGNHFIRFLRVKDSSFSQNDYQALLIFVGGAKPSPNTLKDLPHPMPAKGLVAGSEKYILGLETARRVLPSFRTDLIGFDQSAEVQLGQYNTGKGVSTLASVSYPTPQIARVRFGSLNNFLGLNQDRGPSSAYGRRQGSYVFLVLNGSDPGTAVALMDQFQVTQGISWDQKYVSERSFTLQLVHMILAIFLLTAFLIGACVVVGVLFFLSRRAAAKFFPESQWGRTDDDQLIRLNLKSQ